MTFVPFITNSLAHFSMYTHAHPHLNLVCLEHLKTEYTILCVICSIIYILFNTIDLAYISFQGEQNSI